MVAALLAMVKRHTRWGFRKYHYRRRKKRRLPERIKQPLAVPKQPNPCWSMGFMNNALTDGRGFRTLNVAEDWNREVLGIEVNFSLPAARVVRLLMQLVEHHGPPGCAPTTAQKLSATCCRTAVASRASCCTGFNRSAPRKTSTWNASTVCIAASCSTATSLLP